MWFKRLSILATIVAVAGCQSLPQPAEKKIPEKATQSDKEQKTPSGVKIHPYDREEIQRQKIVIPEQKSKQQFDDGRQLPAFKSLMQKTQTAYRQGQWSQAQSYAMQAQRLAPQSSETFLYLALIANQQKQPANAESLARRGLSYAQSNAMKKQLWSIILKAGQMQKNQKTIQQAQTAIKSLS
ncbi:MULTISPECIES: tetratricopeptide repeat protein [Acinetobacter]|uniref:tetratricopeptide repeat protein n=1 Tax=Acinetobacter TaxID=469 RepID=UPI001F607559|nr:MULTISPECIES: tetratricopeptide repeat protein [Acinetobacter]MDH1277698.1 tetratricopeptide repeat protein [Acinetobacter johnsonii]MDH1712404.1 tetratricopeptide repeat protein [Acinetobacter johnsonii]MDQ8974419.1 tetratricopeptide repeat protein [Acinetobacter johnsonii]UNT42363.1 tetratricopeptide repeat protein [Acinetobacter sp. LUNF3]